MNPMRIEDKLAVNKYAIDKEVHIRVKDEICRNCKLDYCVYACPAGCYSLSQERLVFSYEGCLECGSCDIACPEGAIEFTLPRAGLGISYEYG